MQKQKGFTLIELLVVVAIIGVLSAVGVLAFNGFIGSAKVNAAKVNHQSVCKWTKAELFKCALDSSVSIFNGQITCSTIRSELNQSQQGAASEVTKELVKVYYDYMVNKEKVCITLLDNRFINPFSKDYGYFNDPQVPQAYCVYGDLVFDNMMIDLKPRIEKETGLELTEMYTFARNYKQRHELKRHKDRGSCEISGTINLGGDPWPIYIDPNPENGYDGDDGKYISSGEKGVEVLLEPGDCMIYLGLSLIHI